MADRKPIEARVAEIISVRSLVLNRGRKHGVTEGMVFAILNRKGEHIQDPDNKADLGSLRIPKIRVRVAFVDENFSLARTFRTFGGSGTLSASTLGARLSIPGIFLGGERIETLRASEQASASEEELDEKDSIVKIGDPAIELIEDSEKSKDTQKPKQTPPPRT